MCSACAASQMSQYILTHMLLCVGVISSPSPSCWGLKVGEDLIPQKPFMEKACGRKWVLLQVDWAASLAPSVDGQWRDVSWGRSRALFHCGSVLSVQFWLALHHMWCACRHPASPSVVANLCCRGLGLMSWVTAGHSSQEWPMVWCTTQASQRRTTNTTDGHKQGFLPKALPTVCCLSLSWPPTRIPAWAVSATWIVSCSGPPQGWQVIHVCFCLGHGCEGPEGMSRERKRGKDGFFHQRHDVWKDPVILRLSWH